MYDSLLTMLIAIAAIGAGLMAGVYFAFSGFIMQSLNRLGDAKATDAMNSINDVILRSWFMVLFFGSTVLFATLIAIALFSTDLAGRLMLIVSGLIYVLGMFVCTAVFNVPLNNRLAHVKIEDSNQSEVWTIYFKRWTRWNHLRAVSSTTSMVLSICYLVNYL